MHRVPIRLQRFYTVSWAIGRASVKKSKGSPYSIAERRVLELIPVLVSQPTGYVSHKPSSRLPLLSARPAVTLATLRGLLPILLLGKQRHDGCDPSAPESSKLTTRLPRHQSISI